MPHIFPQYPYFFPFIFRHLELNIDRLCKNYDLFAVTTQRWQIPFRIRKAVPSEISWMLNTGWGALRGSGREIRRLWDRLLEIFHNRESLFLQRRNVAPNPCEDFRPRHAPKGARDLLVDFHHPDVLFGLIIRIWLKVTFQSTHPIRSATCTKRCQ